MCLVASRLVFFSMLLRRASVRSTPVRHVGKFAEIAHAVLPNPLVYKALRFAYGYFVVHCRMVISLFPASPRGGDSVGANCCLMYAARWPRRLPPLGEGRAGALLLVSRVHADCHRAVVNQLHFHVGSELAGEHFKPRFAAQLLAEAFVQRYGNLVPGGVNP